MSRLEGEVPGEAPPLGSGGFIEEESRDGRRGRRLSPATWVTIGLGAALILVLLGVAVTRQYNANAAGGNSPPAQATSAVVGGGGAGAPTAGAAPAQSVTDPSGATVFRQTDPAAVAARSLPAMATTATEPGGARGPTQGPTQSVSPGRSVMTTQAPAVTGGVATAKAGPSNVAATYNTAPGVPQPRGVPTPLIGAVAPAMGVRATPGQVPAPPKPAPGTAPP